MPKDRFFQTEAHQRPLRDAGRDIQRKGACLSQSHEPGIYEGEIVVVAEGRRE